MIKPMQDPLDPSRWLIPSAADELWGENVGSAVLTNVHPDWKCEGRGCSIHHPSDHKMVEWRMHWRGDRGFFERICPCHGIGHPDPDDAAFVRNLGGDISVHGCTGCCAA